MLKTRGFEGYCIMEFSKRLDLFGDEIFAALNERKVALEAQGRTIYNLSVGTPDFAPAEHIRKAMMDAAADPQNWKYSLRDLPELLDAVCGYYKRRFGVEITPDQVASCAGSQEGVGHIGMVLCDEGDTVLLMSGSYDLQVIIKGRSFQEIAIFVAKRLSPLDDVLSTATSFVLRPYKRGGRLYLAEEPDERECTVL